ncbi:MAG: site-specific DNA-methyltransferase [Myxococcales bacterium]|nr:site-specific DNA-methyltransferase [Myxococcales bacterium]
MLGFEVRDVVSHLFGSGFPKSMDIGKAIDKMRDDDRAETLQVTAWIAMARDAAGLTNGDIDRALGLAGMSKRWTTQKKRPTVPSNERMADLLDVLGVNQPPEDIKKLITRLNDRKGRPGDAWNDREVIGSRTGANTKERRMACSATSQGLAISPLHEYLLTAPATEGAKKWEGFGTALKPAAEFWILCRKPIAEKSIAANVLKFGTGALNIDGCRVKNDDSGTPNKAVDRATRQHEGGRWPAHIVFDEHAAAVLDEQGPRSRFFYVAKPSRAEKDTGLEHIAVKTGGEATGRKEGSAGVDNPRAGAGRTGGGRNHHPTVKAQELMAWLCRLITPPGGTVLDPFAGSGSTGVAAIAEGFSFIGCEMTPDYVDLTTGRLSRALHDYTGRALKPLAVVSKYEPPQEAQLELFGKIAK